MQKLFLPQLKRQCNTVEENSSICCLIRIC